MRLHQGPFIIFLLGLLIIGSMPLIVYSGDRGITERECALQDGAEIIWDLNKYRWLCCIPKNEDEYETCIPITDMKPLPKTSLKPLPPNISKTVKPEKQ